MDGVGQEDVHLVVGEFSQYILRNELIFKAVPDQVIGRDAAVQQALDLLDEAVFQAFVQPAVDALDAFLAGDESSDVEGLLWQALRRDSVLAVELVGPGGGLDVQARTAAQDGHAAAGADIGPGIGEGRLIFVDVVFAACRDDVDQVVRHLAVLAEVLSRP